MAAEEGYAEKKKNGHHGGPCICPQWVVYDDGFAKLYYCYDYGDSDLCQNPTVDQYYGNEPFPCTCGPNGYGCLEGARNGGGRPFPGLPRPIHVDEDFEPPDIVVGYTSWCHFGKLPFVKFQDTSNHWRYAKVFRVNAHFADFPCPKKPPAVDILPMFVAFECNQDPDQPFTATAADRRTALGGATKPKIYRLEWTDPNGKLYVILALMGA